MVHTRFDAWTKWQFSLERSPVFHAEGSRTALLIAAGQDDTRVHPSQSLQLYRALKLIGKTPVRYVRYPGEGHGNRKAAARDDYARRLMRWMDHFVRDKRDDLPRPGSWSSISGRTKTKTSDEKDEVGLRSLPCLLVLACWAGARLAHRPESARGSADGGGQGSRAHAADPDSTHLVGRARCLPGAGRGRSEGRVARPADGAGSDRARSREDPHAARPGRSTRAAA